MISGTTRAVTSSSRMLWGAMVGGSPAPDATPAVPPAAGDHPSYLSADSFVSALIGALTSGSLAAGQATPTFAEVQAAIERLPPSRIKGALLANLTTAEGNLAKFRQGLSTWFDDSMERLTGAYKRHLKLISIVIGLAVAVVMNADTFAVGYALWANPALRQQMIDAAAQTQKSSLSNLSNATPTDVAKALDNANKALRPMLPLGWPMTASAGEDPRWFWLVQALGWIVTALALSLGAPFWFDLLGKFVNIRGAGSKPKRADATTA
jgi:hypothetical protein